MAGAIVVQRVALARIVGFVYFSLEVTLVVFFHAWLPNSCSMADQTVEL